MHLYADDRRENMNTIKHMDMNLVLASPGKDSLKVCRKAAGGN